MPSPSLSTAVQAALRPFIDEGSIAGVVACVADSSGILSTDTVGYSDIGAGRRMQPDTLFWIASQTKPFVSAAVMMLVERGELSISDPVARYIPDFENQWLAAEQDDDHILLTKPARSITISDLLTHTSGMPFKSALESPKLDALPLRDRVTSYTMTPLLTQPGAFYTYSNAGVNTAGRIVELVTGQEFAAFLQTYLLTPLEMTDTTFWPSDEQINRLAKTYKPGDETGELEETTLAALRYPLNHPERQVFPAGGLFSTAPDVARFCRMFLRRGELDGRRYLSEDSVREITRGRQVDGTDMQTGLLWSVDADGFWHAGAAATRMDVIPAADRVLVYLVQHTGVPRNGADGFAAFLKASLERV